MRPDDPRHGTYAGAAEHWRARERPCEPCHLAGLRVRKRNKYLEASGKPQTVPKVGTVRRIRALQTLGWTLGQIAEQAGLPSKTLKNPLYRGTTCYRSTANAVAAAYARLAMTFPPEDTYQQRRDAGYARAVAARHGWAPPLAWDDIDNPDEHPKGHRHPNWDRDYDTADLVDESTVQRVIDGENLRTNRAEKLEIMRRWLASGRSERSLCVRLGWKDGRYTPREDGAA